MPAANLVVFAFRLALTLASGKRGFVDTPSVQRIRLLSVKDDDESMATCSIVDELYNNGAAGCVKLLRRSRRHCACTRGMVIPAMACQLLFVRQSFSIRLMFIFCSFPWHTRGGSEASGTLQDLPHGYIGFRSSSRRRSWMKSRMLSIMATWPP